MTNQLLLLGLFLVFGLFLLRGGITGNVISESCCFPPNCAAENICPASSASLESPATLSPEDNDALQGIGLLLIVISISMVFGYLKLRAIKQTA
jgi:hypothetical protein